MPNLLIIFIGAAKKTIIYNFQQQKLFTLAFLSCTLPQCNIFVKCEVGCIRNVDQDMQASSYAVRINPRQCYQSIQVIYWCHLKIPVILLAPHLQLTMLANFNKVLYFFARSLRRAPRNTPKSEQQSLQQSQQPSAVENKSEQRSLEQELEDELQPLSYDKMVQDSLRNKVAEELKYSYEGEDPSPHKLVHRPSKGAAWGLGGQLMLASKKVQLEGLKAETDEIVEFLQLHQCKNIYVHDFFAQNTERRQNNRKRYAILASCFSSKHCWKTGIQLKNAFNLNSAKTKLKRRKEYDPIYAVMNGGKAEEWCLVEYKEYEVSLMTEEQRQAMDLEWKWNNPVSDEVLDKHIEMKLMKKGRKRQFQDLD